MHAAAPPVPAGRIRTGAQMSYLGYYGDAARRPRSATPYRAAPAAAATAERRVGRRRWTCCAEPPHGATTRSSSAPAPPARCSRTASPRRAGGCWCSSADRTPTPASSATTRSASTSASTTRAHSSWRRTSACRFCRACASAAARRSTMRSASPLRAPCSTTGRSAGSTATSSRSRSARSASGSASRRSARRRPRTPPSASRRRSAPWISRAGSSVMEANITAACRGTGYCNIGCAYGAKMSALDSMLPWAQQRLRARGARRRRGRGDPAPGRPRHPAERHPRPSGRARSTVPPTRSSWPPARSARARCCSAAASAATGSARGLHFNINSPLTADFPDGRLVRRHPDVARVPRPAASPRYLVETWFNPPATQALAMPGWFDHHFENMQPLPAHGVRGVLVGTTTPGRVKPGAHAPADRVRRVGEGPRRVDRRPQGRRADLHGGRRRARDAGHLHLARVPHAGVAGRARRADPRARRPAHDQRAPAGRQRARHGGRRGLPRARSRNLYLCDASVFPTSVHVNPQLTVMGMAQYAARRLSCADARDRRAPGRSAPRWRGSSRAGARSDAGRPVRAGRPAGDLGRRDATDPLLARRRRRLHGDGPPRPHAVARARGRDPART